MTAPIDAPAPSPPPTAVPTASTRITIGSADDWVRRTVTAGEAIDAEHGALFVDAATGEGELWAIGASPFFGGYSWSPGGRYVLAQARVEQRVIDREGGTAYHWSWGGKTSGGPVVFAVEAAEHLVPDHPGRGVRLRSRLTKRGLPRKREDTS
ncbi:MAG: hypothetical protein V3S31_08635 [Dehalococcoidia bacterium]